jgi:hypothetical protein
LRACPSAFLAFYRLVELVSPSAPGAVRTDQPKAAQELVVPLPSLIDIFDLDKKPFGLVLAAIFGLSPTALLSRLQQEAEKYKADLKSSGTVARS